MGNRLTEKLSRSTVRIKGLAGVPCALCNFRRSNVCTQNLLVFTKFPLTGFTSIGNNNNLFFFFFFLHSGENLKIETERKKLRDYAVHMLRSFHIWRGSWGSHYLRVCPGENHSSLEHPRRYYEVFLGRGWQDGWGKWGVLFLLGESDWVTELERSLASEKPTSILINEETKVWREKDLCLVIIKASDL